MSTLHRHRAARGILLAIIFASGAGTAQAARFAGTIDASGYRPPSGVIVIWRIPGQADVLKSLNPAVPYTGDGASLIGRYASGDSAVIGRQIVPYVTSEHGGGLLYVIVKALYQDAGITREPTIQELYDFAVANGAGKALFGCTDHIEIVGRPDPGCVEIPPPDTLRPQPVTPPGCCRPALPCLVSDPSRLAGEVWTEPVRTPQGGRIGCNLKNVGEIVVEPRCGDGICAGAETPENCRADCQPPDDGECPECPKCPDTALAGCQALAKALEAAETAKAEAESLRSRVRDLEAQLATHCPTPSVPADVAATLREIGNWRFGTCATAGPARKGRVLRVRDFLCSIASCPP